jgi:hypothetical protein
MSVYDAVTEILARSTLAVAARWSMQDHEWSITVANTAAEGAGPHSPANGSPVASVPAGESAAGSLFLFSTPRSAEQKSASPRARSVNASVDTPGSVGARLGAGHRISRGYAGFRVASYMRRSLTWYPNATPPITGSGWSLTTRVRSAFVTRVPSWHRPGMSLGWAWSRQSPGGLTAWRGCFRLPQRRREGCPSRRGCSSARSRSRTGSARCRSGRRR